MTGELLLGKVSDLASSSTLEHRQAAAAGAGGELPPSPPAKARISYGGRPSRGEELVRDLALFATGFSLAAIAVWLIEGRKQ